MKSIIRENVNPRRMVMRNVKKPKININEKQAIIKVGFVGICGRDIEHFNTKFQPNKVPYIPGHEFSGTINELPNKYQGALSIGDRVVCETVGYVCEKCVACKKGLYNLCKKRKNIGGSINGAFAEFVKTPIKYIHKVPKNVSLKEAALIEPFCVCYNALINNSKIRKNNTVIVFGSGTIGLISVILVKYLKARVILITLKKNKMQVNLAKKLGTNYILYSNKFVIKKVMNITGDQGAELIVDTVGGDSKTIEMALELVAPGGQITKIGWFMKNINANLDKLVRKNITLQGSFSHNYDVWEKCIKILKTKKIKLKKLITNIYALNEWKKAYNLLENRKAIKILLNPKL